MADDPPLSTTPDELWWMSSSTARDMIEVVEPEIKGRKWRLFMCACGRRCLDQMPGDWCREAVGIGEAHADGLASDDAMIAVAKAAHAETLVKDYPSKRFHAGGVATAIASLGGNLLFEVTVSLIEDAIQASKDQDAEHNALSALLRDIFGNPFCPAIFSPEWRTDITLTLAAQMYDSRDFSAMPILADALQDAGCDNTGILSHCRDANQIHVRGCWVVDLLLGKK